ncbi:MAG TPA: hypothetical protein VKY19_06105 [Ktedonosporobacter sp.]|jgi:hypothetical protein|nr:hypothetical protein [Ktedonosporobacter sp.]
MSNTAQSNEMKVIREVSIQAENCYKAATALGDHAAHVLGNRHRAQMTGLENVADSTFKTSDVFDYIKRQTARQPHWRQPSPEEKNSGIGFGERLKNYLEGKLKESLKEPLQIIYHHLNIGNNTDEDQQERKRIHLLLIRQIIHHMVIQYEYRVSTPQNNPTNKKRES